MGKKLFISVILFILIAHFMQGQIPTSCFEIESILVDACGDPEGENEMVRFKVGPNSLNTAAMVVDWPNNSWLGTCQDGTTAAKVTQLNATITSCGLLLEPVGGLLPAGASVILVSSTNFNAAANSFAGLSDTVYIVFQCAGNTSGHFANATGSGTRNLAIDFGPTCSDNVSYNCGQLVDVFGNTGAMGATTDRDGAAVVYNWQGNGTYINNGCTAPINSLMVDAGINETACEGDTIQLNGQVVGNYTNVYWSGGNGSWINNDQLSSQYVVGAGDPGTNYLLLNITTCNGSLTDTLWILSNPPPVITTQPPAVTNLCSGLEVFLDAGIGGPFIWSTGETTNTISVNSSGIYYVNAVNICGVFSDTVFFNVNESDVLASFYVDSLIGAAPLMVNFTNQSNGADSYEWSFGDEGTSSVDSPTFSFLHPGEHLVILTATNNGGCSDTASIMITVLACEGKVYIPNSFSPNLDEINPIFYISSNCAYKTKTTIFDRWGNEIFSWTDIAQGWNGLNAASKELPIGIYTYLFELEDLNGEFSTYRGQLNLLR